MSKMFQKAVLSCGLLSLVHAAYSAAQHRTYLRITEQEFSALPLDIIIQAVVSLAIVVYSVLAIVGEFKEIRAAIDLQEKSWETLACSSFYIFNHRGKSLSPDYKQPPAINSESLND
ncbi:unnamed protein product [Diamesa hyperborea]